MHLLTPLLISTAFWGSSPSGRADSSCQAHFEQNRPTIHWADSSLKADLTFDGSTKVIVWGTASDSFFVGVIECPAAGPARTWVFPIKARDLFREINLKVSLEDPWGGMKYYLSQCNGRMRTAECVDLAATLRVVKTAGEHGGRGIKVGSGDQEPVHIYWDPLKSQFVTWRLPPS